METENNYTMSCANGWTDTFTAKNLRGAKAKATKMATHGCGSYSLHTPNDEIHTRRQWQGFNTWGWDKWQRDQ